MKPARMQAEMVDIGSLTADPRNARRHSRRNIDSIKSSLSRFGQQKPVVVDGKGQIVAGHGMVDAAKALGWSQVAIVRTKLVGPEAAAFAIADNRVAELSEWDHTVLAATLESLKVDGNLEDLVVDRDGVPTVTIHDLRRSAITNWTKAANVQTVAKLAGHADIATTMTFYAAVTSDQLDAVRAANTAAMAAVFRRNDPSMTLPGTLTVHRDEDESR